MTSTLLPGTEPAAKSTVTVASVLRTLSKERLRDVARDFHVALPTGDKPTIAALANDFEKARAADLPDVLARLLRDELKKALKAHGLDDSGRSRAELADRLLERSAHATTPSARVDDDPTAPRKGRLAVVRQRQYLITDVVPPPETRHATPSRPVERVQLVCLDDDAPGRELEVFWRLELGARVIQLGAEGLGEVRRLDDPATFGAYLNTLRWNALSATDSELFQAPFRAGIALKNHQIPPLQKALALPRANLFIADDVGLGKTIEAGLVLQELILRQQVERVLIVAPAAIKLQWRDEMEQRFGQRFEIMNRAYVARCRRERGFGANPWATHSRFIVSYQTLRRAEYLEPLRDHLHARARRSLLILDEAHTVAPATASRYAVDSNVTNIVRDLAGRFDNRLFLSATPHNGHSNSFSALLEILDPARFTRGVAIADPDAQLAPVLIRRLKRDIKALGEKYPDRHVVRVSLERAAPKKPDASPEWTATYETLGEGKLAATAVPLGGCHDAEVRLSELLAEYTALAAPHHGRGRLVFVSLQKRLLSSLEAFHRTLAAHTTWLEQNPLSEAAEAPRLPLDDDDAGDPETYGESDDALDRAEAEEVAAATVAPPQSLADEIRGLLAEMRTLTARHRHAPSPKVLALRKWLEASCLQGKRWGERRVIVFTEYGDTKRYLRDQLREAIADTDRADERIVEIHGGMGDEKRAAVQQQFNDPKSPARILLATDAAREGVNLQGACADLFHFDVPWNPARLEQRNGRIDRTLQPKDHVYCHYFAYPQRAEDMVLDVLVAKVETIQAELGSLGTVVLDQIEKTLERGIRAEDAERIARADADLDATVDRRGAATRELESQRAMKKLRKEHDDAGKQLQKSRARVGVDPQALRAAVDVGMRLVGAGPLVPAKVGGHDGKSISAWRVPHEALAGWDKTLDTLRRPRKKDEEIWEWRKRAPRAVVFEPTGSMGDPVVHLHLEHPFVKRALSRFRAQGFGQSDLSRASVVRTSKLHEVRVVAFARLSLFGEGARRLHDELVGVSAPWRDGGDDEHLRPYDRESAAHAQTMAILDDALVAAAADDMCFPKHYAERYAPAAADAYAALWQALDAEADAHARKAEVDLEARGRKDADALKQILERQRDAIAEQLNQLELDLGETQYTREEQIQRDRDKRHMMSRKEALAREILEEPAAVRSLFAVTLRRVSPVGLVFLWPETRA